MSKKMLSVLVVLLICSATNERILAQTKYPEKPIEALVQYAPGASTDAAARVMAEFLAKQLGQPVVIMNKPGGAGSIAGNALVKAKPDGYTLGFFNTNQPTPEYCMNPERFTYKSKDMIAVSQWSGYAPGMFVRYDAPWNSVAEFVEHAKKNPDKLKWGHSGRGNMWWIIGSVFVEQFGLKMADVPFEGDGQNMTALLGSHIDMSVLTCAAGTVAQMEAKKLKPLFLATAKRLELVPNVPTAEEAGVSLGIPDIYLGTFVPKGTPKEIVLRLSEATKKVTEDPMFKERMRKIWFPVWYRDTKDFEDLVEKFGKIQGKYLKQFGILQ